MHSPSHVRGTQGSSPGKGEARDVECRRTPTYLPKVCIPPSRDLDGEFTSEVLPSLPKQVTLDVGTWGPSAGHSDMSSRDVTCGRGASGPESTSTVVFRRPTEDQEVSRRSESGKYGRHAWTEWSWYRSEVLF